MAGMILDEAWAEHVRRMQAFMERVKPALDLLDKHEPQLALDKLTYLLEQAPVEETDKWQALMYKSWCYRDLGEAAKCLAYGMEAVHSTEGQSLFTQQKTYGSLIFYMYETLISDEELKRATFAFDELNRKTQIYEHDRERHREHEKIRVGYIASRFTENVLSYFVIQLLCAYDRKRFEVYCYSYGKKEDRVTEFIRPLVKKFYVGPYGPHTPPDIMAAEIYEDGVDILFDLSGHTENSLGLIAASYKPAPVQLTGIGFMGTSGMKAMDYFLGDPYCDPPGLNENDFSEEILRLPHSHFCYTPSELALHITNKYRPKKPGEEILLASFGNFRKLNEPHISLWAEILRRLPQARLLLRSSDDNRYMQRKVREMFRAQGLESTGRVIIERPDNDYLNRYQDVDLLLDTYPYVGGGTTCDALYAGVPVISLYGRRHGTRFGYSLLTNAGLGELAAATKEEYVEKAVALGSDPELLAVLHERIPEMFRKSPIMDAVGYMRDVQAAYEHIWQRWLAGK